MAPAYKAHAGTFHVYYVFVLSKLSTDLSPAGGWLTLKEYLDTEEYQHVVTGRWRVQIVTCWRPLVAEVQDCPLAFCSRSSLEESDCVVYDRVDASSLGEGMFLQHNDEQQWFWLSRQTCDEVFVFKCWDSQAKALDGMCASRPCNALR